MQTIEKTIEPYSSIAHPLASKANQIALEQRKEIRFDYRAETKIDEIHSADKTRCVGMTLLGSYALENSNIEHSIAFMNGHASIIVPDEGEMYLIDFTSPVLNQPISDKLVFYSDETPDRKFARLNTARLIIDSGLDWVEASQKIKWLRLDPALYRAKEFSVADETSRGYSVITSIFNIEAGRKSIYDFQKYREALSCKDMQAAGQCLVELSSNVPEADIRSDFYKSAKLVIRRLAAAKHFDLAREAADAIFGNLTFSSDSRVKEYEADCLRYIAVYSGQKGLAAKALELYKSAIKQPSSFNTSLSAKIDLCQSITS